MPNVHLKIKCIAVEMFSKSLMFPNGNIGHKCSLFPFGNMMEKFIELLKTPHRVHYYCLYL